MNNSATTNDSTWADYVDIDLPKGAQSIVRTAALLRILATHNKTGLRLKDICDLAGLEQPTAHRIITALNAVGFVARHPKTKKYHLGPLLQELYISAYQNFSIREALLPSLHRIASALGDTVYLTMRDGLDSVCIERVEGHFPIRTCTVDIGKHRPLGVGAGGIALISSFKATERELVLHQNRDRYPDYGTDIDAVRERCLSAAQTGYTFDYVLSGIDIKAIGFAIKGYSGRPRRRD